MRQPGGQGVKKHVDLAADQIGDGQCRPLVRNVHHEHIGLRLEELGRELHDGAVAAGGVVEPARVLARMLDPLLDGFGGRVVGHQHDAGCVAQMPNGREVTHRVIGHARVEVGADGMCAGGGQQQGVTIGRRLGREVGAQRTAGAGLVVHHHRLAQPFAEFLREAAGKQVGGPTGREGHNEADRLGRVGLRMGHAGQRAGGQAERGTQRNQWSSFHAGIVAERARSRCRRVDSPAMTKAPCGAFVSDLQEELIPRRRLLPACS